MAEDILYISDNPMPGEIVTTKEDADGKRIETKREDMLGHRRLMVETRKFLMAKQKPKKYGDKLVLDSKTKIEGSVTHKLAEKSDDELRAIAAAYAADKQKAAENAN
jgi:hypothetical protein